MNEERIFEIIAEQLNVNRDELTKETKLSDDLGADSLDLFQIIMALEDEYGIEIPTEDAEGIRTVENVIDYIKTRI